MDHREHYRQFCREIPDLPIFMAPWYLDAIQDQAKWDAVVVRRKGKVVAAMPFFLKKKWRFKSIVLPTFVKYLGPILRPELRQLSNEHRFYRELIDQLPDLDSFRQNFHPGVTNWLPFYWTGFRQTVRYTYRLSLENLDLVHRQIVPNKRREIRKADSYLQLRHDLSPADFYAVNKMSFDRQQMAIPYSFRQFAHHDQALAQHQSRKLFFALDREGNIHAVAYLIWDNNRAYYHLAGDNPLYRKHFGGFWLIWKCIEYTKKTLGLNEFDFEGSMIARIEAVRRHFGAHQVPYFYIWKYPSASYRLVSLLRGGGE